MSSSPAFAQLSSDRSPSLSSAFARSFTRETPSTPPGATSHSPRVPPTPPDSSSRAIGTLYSSPRSDASTTTSAPHSLSTTLSAAAPQFQSRLLDTPNNIHHSPATSVDNSDTGSEAVRDGKAAYRVREQVSPAPIQDAASRRGLPEQLPPPFVPAAVHFNRDEASVPAAVTPQSSPDSDSEPKPPNVYINGLPPNFPEEDLLAMCSPFGTVLSVRTFTRHVSDKPSGYGFVLFERLAAAEKCIEALRKYRNLHPSFSKQVHKIPGTAYASAPSASNTGPVDSFKAKMEQLRDTGSTNLYMEGLPLSVTEQELRVLVTPYRIMSSRFFHTRLSHPPRIIAFVRLESREAAEDVIERLHGRLVRGRNDAGCRISVRFADTPEQRELRYQSNERSPTLDALGMAGLQHPISPELGFMLNTLGSGSVGQLSPVSLASPHLPQEAFVGGMRPQSLSPFIASVSAFDTLNAQAAHITAQDLRLTQQLLPEGSSDQLDEQTQLRLALLSMQAPCANAQQGYTSVERLILQAHARQRANTLGATLDTVQRPPDVHRNTARQSAHPSTGQDVDRRLLNYLPGMSEDDFHASAGLLQKRFTVAPNLPRQSDASTLGQARSDVQPSNMRLQQDISGQQLRQRNHTLAAQLRVDPGTQGFHARSSTLPSPNASMRRYSQALANPSTPLCDSARKMNLNASDGSGHESRPHGSHSGSRIVINHQQIASSLGFDGNAIQRATINNLRADAHPNTHTLFTSKSNINLPSASARAKEPAVSVDGPIPPPAMPPSTNINSQAIGTDSTGRPGSHATGPVQEGDADDEESPVVSPALTYSTRTPASLSPATPYSGFFSDGGATFRSTTKDVGAESMESLRFTKEGVENRETVDVSGGVHQQ
ncbi:hypothetical protein BN946_scf184664.g1 [Trametes cinnabarina]|uniref:RRM domain-containing protein n=1 Tax=Pycnoporus cinnabarinus TaxID=5643 RepID=A0A060T0E7_PYCCI|nr:hypothetical protein BN946_scf184664.g1 [Trametes cinnabarina]